MPGSITSSLLRRKLFEPLIFRLNGSPLLRYWRELEQTQFLPEEELKNRQWQRLERMLCHVWENNSFYRERFEKAGITPESVRSPEDLHVIPLLTKEDIRKNTLRMISRDFDTAELQHYKTGGSTGKPLDVYLTEKCSELRNACARRHDRWTGWEVGEPVGAVWGNPELPKDIKGKLKNWLLNPLIYLDTMNVTEHAVKTFAAEWERAKPSLLYGHAHSLYILAEYVNKLGIKEIKPRGILSTSMMLLPNERKFIESVFGVKVTDRYGCEELSLIASECEKHEGLHLNIEHLYIEFLKEDNTPAKPGEQGKIVITDLMNYAMPFIRYQVEDMGIPSERKCSCGRGLPLMEQVTGRVADYLIRRDGSRVAGVSLIENTLTKFSGIAQLQIVQETMDQIVLLVVPALDYSRGTQYELSEYFIKLLGNGVNVTIKLVDCIKPEKSGKYRFSICRVQ
ncbi:phenylacetate--CoA ligase family protein [Oryzomonas sagensis]|uniref:Phenylacetate--CoA ligase family protein n=1 Tax=Oryzomonas sagensis TaxID=2603857 RepID=A0ABQ6TKA9_9BACT|nr:phenylacetate--CoA ligase family protein [Oryzomonas sagensis]KAB0668513.1 phenylacetate--CoA ligase family protein [Oryzomonas sagensis]